MEYIKNFIFGMIIGLANIIPGVSGGTMIVVFGIYDKVISSIINFFKDIKKNFLFLLPLALGGGTGILVFAKLIKWCLNNFPQETNFLFIGLIVGTIPMIYKKCTETKLNKLNLVWFIIALAISFLMGFLRKPESSGLLITSLSVINGFKVFLGGFIAAAAMILPGISGSFILLLLGLYDSIINAITQFNIPILFVTALGIVFGFLTMTKIIDILFKKYPQTAYFIILGLIIGSIYAIFSEVVFVFLSVSTLISVVTFIIGFLIAYFLGN